MGLLLGRRMEHGCYRIRKEIRTIHLNLFQGVEYESL
jgi:hypothetical protein